MESKEEFKIPSEAKQIKEESYLIDNINEWFCPDCEIKGDADDIDFIQLNHTDIHENKRVQYCCPNCFEFNLYVTFYQD